MKKTSKKWLNLRLDLEEEPVQVSPVAPQTKFKNGNLSPLPVPLPKKRQFNFHQKLAPKTVSDLAVHSKKITEVETWFLNNITDSKANSHHTAKFLLITGPTGCGKTATLQVLATTMGIELTEWVNPIDQDFEIFKGPNQINKFLEFLTESKWNSLFSKSDKKVILVEEFPNVLVRNPGDFASVLEECYYKGNYPIVFICTDSSDSKNLSEKLFTQELINKYRIAHVSFNSCAATLLKSALKRAHNLVQDNLDLFKTPSHNTVNAILATSMGDIKCAINQYYFASLLGTSDLPTVSEKLPQKSGTKRKRNENLSSVQIMSRDETLGLFHGIGRVLNPKRIDKNGSWRLQCDLEKLIDEFSTQPGIFTAFLFENYIKYYGDINDTYRAAEILSLSQTFLEKWVDRNDVLTFALWISVLGLMIHNEHKVSKWNQITGPKKVLRNSDSKRKGLPVTDVYYYNVINNVENSRFKIN